MFYSRIVRPTLRISGVFQAEKLLSSPAAARKSTSYKRVILEGKTRAAHGESHGESWMLLKNGRSDHAGSCWIIIYHDPMTSPH
jgi:hypothetical protein